MYGISSRWDATFCQTWPYKHDQRNQVQHVIQICIVSLKENVQRRLQLKKELCLVDCRIFYAQFHFCCYEAPADLSNGRRVAVLIIHNNNNNNNTNLAWTFFNVILCGFKNSVLITFNAISTAGPQRSKSNGESI